MGDYCSTCVDDAGRTKSSCSLSSDWSAVLERGFGADITLKLADGERRVHKLVLGARSVVFRQMFETNMIELRTGTVDMPDVEGATIDAFLRFLYTGALPGGDSQQLDLCKALLPLAKKYEVTALTDHCSDKLKTELKVDNAAALLQMADTFNVTTLREAAIKFISRNRETLVAVQETKAFDLLDKDVMKELFAAVTGSTGSKRKVSDEYEFPDGSNWSGLAVAQLRRACGERNLATSGNKAALIARLQ